MGGVGVARQVRGVDSWLGKFAREWLRPVVQSRVLRSN